MYCLEKLQRELAYYFDMDLRELPKVESLLAEAGYTQIRKGDDIIEIDSALGLESQAGKEASATPPTQKGLFDEVDSSEIIFTDKKGKEHTLTKEVQEQWLETFNLKSLDESYTPKLPQELADTLGKEIRLTKGSLYKIVEKGREQYIPQIKETLEKPQIVLQDESELIFAKQIKDDLYLTSIGKDFDTHITIISNSPKTDKTIQNKLKNGKMIYKAENAEALPTSGAFTETNQVPFSNNTIPQKPKNSEPEKVLEYFRDDLIRGYNKTLEAFEGKRPLVSTILYKALDPIIEAKTALVKEANDGFKKILQKAGFPDDVIQEKFMKSLNFGDIDYNLRRIREYFGQVEKNLHQYYETHKPIVEKLLKQKDEAIRLYESRLPAEQELHKKRILLSGFMENARVYGSKEHKLLDNFIDEIEAKKGLESTQATLAPKKSLFDEVDSKQIQNSHNLHTLRENAKTTLTPLINKEITNINTQEVATLTNKGIRKMTSDKAVAKSVANGFSEAEHFKAVEQVTKLFEKATKATSYTDPTDINLTIHRYNAPFENANALLTLKEYMQDGKRMYSLELENLDAIKFNPSGKDLMEQSPKSKDIDTANFNAPSENPSDTITQNSEKLPFEMQVLAEDKLSGDEVIHLANKIGEKSTMAYFKDYLLKMDRDFHARAKDIIREYYKIEPFRKELENQWENVKEAYKNGEMSLKEFKFLSKYKDEKSFLNQVAGVLWHHNNELVRNRGHSINKYGQIDEGKGNNYYQNLALEYDGELKNLKKWFYYIQKANKQAQRFFNKKELGDIVPRGGDTDIIPQATHQDYNTFNQSLKDAHDFFKANNKDPYNDKLFNDVIKVANALDIRFWYQPNAVWMGGSYTYTLNRIMLQSKDFSAENAKTMLHELIHSVTSRAIYAYENKALRAKLSKEQIEAITELKNLYKEVSENNADKVWKTMATFRDEVENNKGKLYGLKNEHEMLAELANPTFREFLKKQNIFSKIVEAMAKIFSYVKDKLTGESVKSTNAQSELESILYKIMDSYTNPHAFTNEMSEHFGSRNFVDTTRYKEYIKDHKEKFDKDNYKGKHLFSFFDDSMDFYTKIAISGRETFFKGFIDNAYFDDKDFNIAQKLKWQMMDPVKRPTNFMELKTEKNAHIFQYIEQALENNIKDFVKEYYGVSYDEFNNAFNGAMKDKHFYEAKQFTYKNYEDIPSKETAFLLALKPYFTSGLYKTLSEADFNVIKDNLYRILQDENLTYRNKPINQWLAKEWVEQDVKALQESFLYKLEQQAQNRNYSAELELTPPNIFHSNPHAGAGLLGGSVAGIEQDENGNITFNPEKFALGLLGGAGASIGISKTIKRASGKYAIISRMEAKKHNKKLYNVFKAIDSSAKYGSKMNLIGKENLNADTLAYALARNKRFAINKLDEKTAKEMGFKYPHDVRRSIDPNNVAHTLNRHGEQSNLVQFSGQKPVTLDEIAKYQDYADNATHKGISIGKRQETANISARQLDGEFYVVVEQIQKGQNELGFKTMYFERGILDDEKFNKLLKK